MYRYCADCKYLKVDDKGNGVYKCTKLKKDVLANTDACENFEFSYKNRADRDKYYDLAKETSSKYKGGPIMPYVAVAIILAVALLLCYLFM